MLQFDSAGKESMLVGKATVNVTASSSPVVFTSTGVSGKSALFSLYNSTRGQTSGNYAGTDSPVTIPAGTSATFTTTVSQSVKTLFAGSYILVPEGLQYYADGAYLSVSKSSLMNARPSNPVIIIGETSPYITRAVYDASSGNIIISGTRFYNATANSVTINGVTKILPSANAAATLLTAVAKDFNITASGIYSLQVSTSEGASNIVNVNVTVTATTTTTTTSTTTASTQTPSQLASLVGAFSQAPAPTLAPASAWSYSWTRNLEVGSSYTDDITALQTALAKEGVYAGEVTGGFYSQTYGAVKAFQAKYGIESTGFVGPLTREKLNSLYFRK